MPGGAEAPELAPRTTGAPQPIPDPARRRPAGICTGPGHIVVYGNEAFVAAYGTQAIGLPAREAMLDIPAGGFAVLDAALRTGRPMARWIDRAGGDWRLTVSPRLDPETGQPYGVRFHLRARSDLPIVLAEVGA